MAPCSEYQAAIYNIGHLKHLQVQSTGRGKKYEGIYLKDYGEI